MRVCTRLIRVKAPSAYSQKVLGSPPVASFWIVILGKKHDVPEGRAGDMTAAPMETLQPAAFAQEKRNWPLVVAAAGEPSGAARSENPLGPLPLSTKTVTSPNSAFGAVPGGPWGP